ncbi:methyltransferase domain-containing protein [Meridianimarinicoccus sp. RP-17]|uniref:methyltransferase domain-containing protein n=1 Tax=Meridianimarinicoccus zhengii TaxID=2056810 RepID=UPI000DAD45E8|nr:methyltransferase domain-containing protein [Phycocomes zhengii]
MPELTLPSDPTPPRPRLTDRAALSRQRGRARRLRAAPDDPGTGALFLHDDAAFELQERLADVNRRFTRPAIVTGHPEFWSAVLPDAQIVPDDETLALREGAHDLVVHAMALHWAADPVGQLVQCCRALEPDGLFLGLTLGGQTLSDLRAALAQAESDLRGGLSPRVVPMGEIRDLGALLQRAGFTMPVADLFTRRVSYGDPLRMMADLRAMGETNALADRSRRFLRRDVLAAACAHYAAMAGQGDGRVTARFDLVTLTGWSPGPGQPRPKRPGSATASLADVLGHPDGTTGTPPPDRD